jgi:phenylpropionate dioxygenase-like ring-hydroxylating dioxygenase large terminal subunit
MTQVTGQFPQRGYAEDVESMPTMQDYLAADRYRVPPGLLERSIAADVPLDPVPKEEYVSEEFARREFEGLWMHVWQMACREREVANPGDHLEYEIGDQSAVIVRGQDGKLRAFHNVCLHRGTKLMPGRGTVSRGMSCTFHAWTWNLDGSLKSIPCRWDFPHVRDDDYRLVELQCDTWNGFVFVNFDLEAAPLAEFLGEVLPRHWKRESWSLERKFKAAHVGAIIDGNWKVALEAFLEVYHVARTHPQLAVFTSDANAQHDQFGLHSRMLSAMGVPSPHLAGEIDEEEIVETMISQQTAGMFQAGQQRTVDFPPVGDGENARTVLTDWSRKTLQAQSGVDYSGMSDTEMIDVVEYFVFPNFVPWIGAFPIVYRSRPWGPSPDKCLFEVMLMASVPEGVELPPDAPLNLLEPGQTYADAPELGGLGPISDQDAGNISRVQQGMKSRGISHAVFADTQEHNIRHFHKNLNDYIKRYAGGSAS